MSSTFEQLHDRQEELELRIRELQAINRVTTVLTCLTLGIPPLSQFSWPKLVYRPFRWKVVGRTLHTQDENGHWFYWDLRKDRPLVRDTVRGIAYAYFDDNEYRLMRLDMELQDPTSS